VSVLCPQAVDTNMLRMAGATAASVDGVLNTDAVAQAVIEAMDAETFLILPHPEVKEYMARKLDRDRWLRGMRRLRDKTGEGQRRPWAVVGVDPLCEFAVCAPAMKRLETLRLSA